MHSRLRSRFSCPRSLSEQRQPTKTRANTDADFGNRGQAKPWVSGTTASQRALDFVQAIQTLEWPAVEGW